MQKDFPQHCIWQSAQMVVPQSEQIAAAFLPHGKLVSDHAAPYMIWQDLSITLPGSAAPVEQTLHGYVCPPVQTLEFQRASDCSFEKTQFSEQ
jgi:hypothetical protein